jgi:two-component system NarL family sensor kinase
MDEETAKRRDVERRLAELAEQQHALVERLQHGQRHFQQLARSVWRVQEDERRRLARELHDGIGQNLTAIMHLISQALADLPPAAQSSRAGWEKIRALTATTLEETRELSRLLRPQILDDLGLEAALRWLARTFGENHQLDIRLDLIQPLPPLDGDRSTLIFRSVQEALTNVARHAQARRVDIGLQRSADGVRLSIGDDGRGCDARNAFARGSQGHGSGIGGMRDRVRLFSGQFAIKSAPGRGFCIDIEFPLDDLKGKSTA